MPRFTLPRRGLHDPRDGAARHVRARTRRPARGSWRRLRCAVRAASR
jgi:hypothetical protein